MIEEDLWNYWYRFVLAAGLVCVLLDAYYRRATKKSGILHILSKIVKTKLFSDVVVTIDQGQLQEISSEDLAIRHGDYDSHDDSRKNVEIEKVFAQAVQVIGEKLKTIGEEYKIETLVGQENLKQGSTNEDENEATLFVNEQQQRFQINKDNDDSRYDSIARLTVLHVFDLDIRDVAEIISEQNEIDWPDKRINKLLIMTLLRSAENDNDKNTEATSVANTTEHKRNEWTIDDDVAGVNALHKFNLALVDLRRYFHYDNDLCHVLQCNSNTSTIPNISSLNSTDFPTFCNKKHWMIIERNQEAKKALELYHNHRGGWEIFDALSTKLVRLGFGKKGTGRIVAATDDKNTIRVLLHVEKVSKKLNDLAERLRKARIDDDYVETDLQIWTIKLDKWKRYISAVSYSIHINEDPTNVLIAKMYISSTIQQLDFEQRFGEVFGDINIEDNGRVIKHGTSECGNAYARTIGKYSQGKHKVQFIINKKNCTVCDIF
ncbi:unnamed protein product [Rotaria sp. Silwood1]|nr:unnamed protein product [Rotaria sp. Silwood1]